MLISIATPIALINSLLHSASSLAPNAWPTSPLAPILRNAQFQYIMFITVVPIDNAPIAMSDPMCPAIAVSAIPNSGTDMFETTFGPVRRKISLSMSFIFKIFLFLCKSICNINSLCESNYILMKSITLVLCIFLLSAVASFAQSDSVSWRPFNAIVTDAAGSPLKGVKVFISSPVKYATSDKNGRFGLTNVDSDDTLHLRYKRKNYDVPVSGRLGLKIRLFDNLGVESDDGADLMDFGYGFVKRRETISVSNGISGEELARTGQSNLLLALQGKVPGFIIDESRDGGCYLKIRGDISFNSPSSPLLFLMELSSIRLTMSMSLMSIMSRFSRRPPSTARVALVASL